MAKFDLQNPGVKEFAVVGGVTLGAALLYFWWKGRKATPAAAAAQPGTDGTSTPADNSGATASPTGLTTQALWLWIQDHQSSTTTTTRPKPPPVKVKPKPKPKKKPPVHRTHPKIPSGISTGGTVPGGRAA